jgi:hypothetical protein
MHKLRYLFWVTCAVVVLLSLLPGEQLPAGFFYWSDKLQHVLAFTVLATIGCLAWPAHTLRVTAGLLVFGVGIEVAQQLSGWRFGDVADWLADATGIGMGWLVATALRRARPATAQAAGGTPGR